MSIKKKLNARLPAVQPFNNQLFMDFRLQSLALWGCP